jgi:hypothetical protein
MHIRRHRFRKSRRRGSRESSSEAGVGVGTDSIRTFPTTVVNGRQHFGIADVARCDVTPQ